MNQSNVNLKKAKKVNMMNKVIQVHQNHNKRKKTTTTTTTILAENQFAYNNIQNEKKLDSSIWLNKMNNLNL